MERNSLNTNLVVNYKGYNVNINSGAYYFPESVRDYPGSSVAYATVVSLLAAGYSAVSYGLGSLICNILNTQSLPVKAAITSTIALGIGYVCDAKFAFGEQNIHVAHDAFKFTNNLVGEIAHQTFDSFIH